MAPLPVDGTARYVVHYTCGTREHTQTHRSDGPISPSAMQTFLIALWEAASPILRFVTINSVDFYANGENFSNPVSMPDFAGQDYGSGGVTNTQQTLELNFVARSTGGRRLRLGFFSPSTIDESWRLTTGENANISNIFDVLDASTDIVAIDGNQVVWKPYANVLYNAYWTRKNRS